MPITLKQVEETYFSNTTVVEVTDPAEINKMMESKTSCCWMAGSKIDDDWAVLCQPSRQSLQNKMVIFVCRSNQLPA